MPVELIINLFGKPAWEIPNFEGKTLDLDFANTLRELAEKLRNRLITLAEVHEKLINAGWEASGSLYGVRYVKDVSLEAAKEELKKLGLEEYTEKPNTIEE